MITFNSPYLHPAAYGYIAEALNRKKLSGDGYFSQLCEDWIERELSVARALITTSCTSALEMSMILLNVGPGDEVIVPSFTFVSCANAVALRGATPVFADIDPETLCISPQTVLPLLTARTKAVMVVHYAGISRDVRKLRELCDERGLVLVEDAAHAFLSKFEDKSLGTFGSLATLSFHETKNFTMGEGGALLINDEKYVERAEIIREKGTNRKQFFKGAVDKYNWVDIGSSYVASDILAAILWAQLEVADSIQLDRTRSWDEYASRLAIWGKERSFELPSVPIGCQGSAHMFQLLTETPTQRDDLLAHLRAAGVNAVFHYLALEGSPFGRAYGQDVCVTSQSVSERLVRLPLYPRMSQDELDQVIAALEAFPG